MDPKTFKNQSAAEQDLHAWNAMNSWPDYSGVNPVYNGLDFQELTRCFLMNKVARAIRKAARPGDFVAERTLESRLENPLSYTSNALLQILNDLRLRFSNCRLRSQLNLWRSQKKNILYVPEPPSRSLAAVLKKMRDFDEIAIADSLFQKPGMTLYKTGLCQLSAGETKFAIQMHEGILRGLLAYGIELSAGDQKLLKAQLGRQLFHLRIATRELEHIRPTAILTHNPRTFPGIDYVFLAQQKNIPVFVIQNGLGGDAHVLNNIYGDYALVYGKAHAERYKLHSKFQPREIMICGAPEMDDLRPPEKIDPPGSKWLWILRAHLSNKCLLPSNSPLAGLQILKGLLDLLKTNPEAVLTIKPHPQGTHLSKLKKAIREAGMSKRIIISQKNTRDLISEANLVFTEDSTAGMEAMFFQKALIHLSFNESNSILPFSEYKASLKASDPITIANAVKKIYRFSEIDLRDMTAGQRSFLSDFAGPCDGRTAERAADFILSKLGGRKG